jgi:hypothetical protein
MAGQLTACGDDEEPAPPSTEDCLAACDITDTRCSFACIAAEACNSSPVRLNLSEGQRRAEVSFEWTVNNQVGIGPQIGIRLPRAIQSMAISIQDGPFPTAVDEVSLDGYPIFQLRSNSPELVVGPGVVGGVVIPNRPGLEVNGGKCIVLRPYSASGFASEPGRLRVYARYADAGNALAVRAVRVDGAPVTDDEITRVIQGANEVYAPAGTPELVLSDIVDLNHGRQVILTVPASLAELRASDVGADADEIVIFFVRNVNVAGLLGLAAGIPGPLGLQRSAGSGVIISVEDHFAGEPAALNLPRMTSTVTHELGHQMGLFHTTERTGIAFDPLPDTQQCSINLDTNNDLTLTATECEGNGAENVMFWSAAPFAQTDVTASQADVLRRSPITVLR